MVFAFFYYGVFHDHASGWELIKDWLVPLWAALFGIEAIALITTKRDLRNLTVIVTVGAVILVSGPVAKIVLYQLDHPAIRVTDARLWPDVLPKPVLAAGAPKPDIYVIIPDDYARTDIFLKQYFHYDNTPFIQQLRKWGFIIPGRLAAPIPIANRT